MLQSRARELRSALDAAMRFLCPTRFGLQSFYPTGWGTDKLQNAAFGRVMSKKWSRRPIKYMRLKAMDAKNGRHNNVGPCRRAAPTRHLVDVGRRESIGDGNRHAES